MIRVSFGGTRERLCGAVPFRYHGRSMSQPATKTRFAPSPTGEIHLGNARTAFFNALLARRDGGVFLLRIEDTDADRSKPIYVDALMADLRWLGMDWQEGPEVGGEHDPYHQAERGELYSVYYQRLEEAGRVYPCFCSEQKLKLSRKAQRSAGQPPRYAGTCAHLSPDEVQANLARGLQPTLRFRVAKGEAIEFDDLVRGRQSFRTDDIGDFIIRRADGSPAFFFSNAIDDSLMEVSHVLRGEDHLTNTPRQLMILEALGLPAPSYGHISLIVGEDGSPLSKRHGSKSVREMRDMGYLPDAIGNYLARTGHTYAEESGYQELTELAAGFELTRLGRAPARHDPAQLLHWQKEAIAHASDERLWGWLAGHRYLDGHIEDFIPSGLELPFVHAVRENIEMPEDAFVWAANLFTESTNYDPEARLVIEAAGADFFRAALQQSRDGEFQDFAQRVSDALGVRGKRLFMPLRAALTGELHDPERGSVWRNGPDMGRVWALLGEGRIERRLRGALSLCEP